MFRNASLAATTMAASRKAARHHNEADLQARAFTAYRRFARPGEPVLKLDTARADVIEIRGRWYVILTAGTRRVAVFRVRTDDKLKRLVRLPRELQGDED